MSLNAETVIMALLGLLCGFLTYWGTRLEARLDKVKQELVTVQRTLPVEYVRRADWKERSAELLESVKDIDAKLDRVLYREKHHEN